MKIVKLQQRSPEWFDWRKKHICASDMPIIMCDSPWKTPQELLAYKQSTTNDETVTEAMQRGIDLEEPVRQMVNKQTGLNFIPIIVEHSQNSLYAASLDGYDASHVILEVKCPNKKDHLHAKKGKVPKHYKAQIQWQLYVTGCQTCYYASYFNEDLEILHIPRDDYYINEELIPAAQEFLYNMRAKTNPDYLFCKNYGEKDVDWQKLWKDACEKYPDLEIEFDINDYKD